jgi:hypothetical protein
MLLFNELTSRNVIRVASAYEAKIGHLDTALRLAAIRSNSDLPE